MSKLMEQTKEKIADVYDLTKEAAGHLKEKIVGEPPMEDKAADAMKEKVDQGADFVTDTRRDMNETRMDDQMLSGDQLEQLGNRIQRTTDTEFGSV